VTAEWFRSCFDDSFIELERLRYPPSLNEAQAAGIARLLGMRRGGRYLDVCCGYGRHLLPLVARNFDVTGIDLSSAMIQALEEDARRRSLAAKVIRTDVRKAPLTDRFDGAYLVGTSFGVFDHRREDMEALKNIHRSLQPGGRFLIDQANPNAFLSSMPSRNTHQIQSQQVVEELSRDDCDGRLVLRRTLRRGSWEKQWVMRFRIYDPDALSRIVQEAGFAPDGFYGDLHGSPYSDASPRLVLLASCR